MKSQTQMKPKIPLSVDPGQTSLPLVKLDIEESNKRKREDDDYDVP
jgi:hypothetical protein